MQFWRVRMQRLQGPRYLALADAIGEAIAASELRPGARLPPQRALAVALGLDLTTVTRGYAEARRRGLIGATVGRGTFVRDDAVPPPDPGATPPLVDMSMNMPPLPAAPSLRALLREGLDRVLRQTDLARLMTYHLGAGSPADRAAGATWLAPVLGDVDPQRLLVATGAQCALTALLAVLARPGDVILTEPLTYPRFRAAAAQAGVRLSAVAADGDGWLPDALDAACRAQQPKAIYCTPTIHNPTTVTMPPARRTAIAEVAQRHGVRLIEDDAYGLLLPVALPAIASLAPAVSYYLGTVSKCLTPGLRIAYVVAPDQAAANQLEAAIRATSLMPPPLMTAVLSQWIRHGEAAALLDGVRAEIAARQAIAGEILPADRFQAQPNGPHLWLTLPPAWHRMTFRAHVRGLGLAVAPSDAFAVGETVPNAVRVSLGAAPDHAALRNGLRAVAAVLQADAPGDMTDIV